MKTSEKSDKILRGYKQYLILEKSLSPNTIDAYRKDLQKLLDYLKEEGKHYLDVKLEDFATFSAGLRDNSRIKMKLSGMRTSNEILLLAYAVDRLSVLIWQNTKDGQKGKNRPKSTADAILNGDMVKQHRTTGFDTPEAFMNAREKIIERR